MFCVKASRATPHGLYCFCSVVVVVVVVVWCVGGAGGGGAGGPEHPPLDLGPSDPRTRGGRGGGLVQPVEPKRFRGQTRVASIENGCSPTSRGVATWLAVSRVFPSRAPLSGDRDSCQVMCRGPGSFALSAGATGLQRDRNFKPLVPHPRSRDFASHLPVTEAFCECGSPPGCVGQAQGYLPKVRSVVGQGCRSLARVCSEAVDFVSSLAGARARDAPPLLRHSSYWLGRRR